MYLKQELISFAKWYQIDEMSRKESQPFTRIVDRYLEYKNNLNNVGNTFKCKDIELQPILCETYKTCYRCINFIKTDS